MSSEECDKDLDRRTGLKRASVATKTIEKATSPETGMRIGKIVKVDDSGQILVDYSENNSGPVVARITTSVKKDIQGKENPAGLEVLLAFDGNNPQHPIIVDTMYSLIDEITEHSTVVLEAETPQDAIIDGKRIVFDAQEDIVLRCGKASITLTKAGKVLIKGEYVLSRSSGPNKIRGGSIQLN
ncbi:MAG TPA: DUF6484 domain-containing protein [Smithellaceae bacterium]|nr:DUF6484 domain-containing protein [Smithellaceae bacterium]